MLRDLGVRQRGRRGTVRHREDRKADAHAEHRQGERKLAEQHGQPGHKQDQRTDPDQEDYVGVHREKRIQSTREHAQRSSAIIGSGGRALREGAGDSSGASCEIACGTLC